MTEDLTKLLSYMNEEDESDIIKAIVSHYIFEYIHLFYNGNGRLGRYLLSSYLAYKLDPFSALSISEAIKNNKNKYGDIFSEVTYF
ncbi:Fic family protein [Helcococcus kunzii]|uniref:Fic family protein n=1 Tax=Helcococcus kunzii TaxID=40091 RepID=UPI0021BBED87|nr:Fic family protein [Helcococcus kunzii]